MIRKPGMQEWDVGGKRNKGEGWGSSLLLTLIGNIS